MSTSPSQLRHSGYKYLAGDSSDWNPWANFEPRQRGPEPENVGQVKIVEIADDNFGAAVLAVAGLSSREVAGAC